MTPVRRQAQTRRVSAADARGYLSKAKEFLRAAQDAMTLENRVAATGNAVHAASRLLTPSQRSGRRSSGRASIPKLQATSRRRAAQTGRRRRLIFVAWSR